MRPNATRFDTHPAETMTQTLREHLGQSSVFFTDSSKAVRRLIVKLYKHFHSEVHSKKPQYDEIERELRNAGFDFNFEKDTAEVFWFIKYEKMQDVTVYVDYALNSEVKSLLDEPYEDFDKHGQRMLFEHILKHTIKVEIEDLNE